MNYHGRESITTNDFRHHCSPINSDIQTVPAPPKSELKDKTSSDKLRYFHFSGDETCIAVLDRRACASVSWLDRSQTCLCR